MENAVDALKTAVAVLIFIIAITASFTMFAKAKVTADSIITSKDKQEYLEAANLDNVLYKDSVSIEKDTTSTTMTRFGDRIVQVEDVISSIYRYNLEKYGVTIVSTNGEVLARFDSNTENIMRQWYNIKGTAPEVEQTQKKFAGKIKDNISINANRYITGEIKLEKDDLKSLYEVNVTGNNQIKVGAPWYGNESEIIKRCNIDISGAGTYTYNNINYTGKDIYTKLNGKPIIEVINEIDNSKYVGDTLLQDYQLPTIEIVYIYS